MNAHSEWLGVGKASLRRTVNMLLAIVLLMQPGCMCGCSAPRRTACPSTECDGSGSQCDAHETIGCQVSKVLNSDVDDAKDDESR